MGIGNNEQREVFESAARTASSNSPEILNQDHRGLHLIIDVTAVTATETVTFTIQGKDPASGEWYDILASAALGAVGTTVLRVYPGLTATANETENDFLPGSWRVSTTHSASGSFTYSVGANLEI